MPRIYGAPVNRKLTVEQAVEIRQRRFLNRESMRSLGIEYDVSKQTISGLIAGDLYPEAAVLFPEPKATWPRCGHERSEDSTSSAGGCRLCQKDYRKRYYDANKPLNVRGNITAPEARMIRYLGGRGKSAAELARRFRRGQAAIRAVLEGLIHPDANAAPIGVTLPDPSQLQLPIDPISLYRAEKEKRKAREAGLIEEARQVFRALVEVA